ncbi:hypothetical protein ACCC88_18260 [Sphingomonas sp. Sphisp140]|uniref:hypothetical protein n=1 Tax=unclassified Sphingomonas TaxID=196159 RepID=UPI0039AF23F5
MTETESGTSPIQASTRLADYASFAASAILTVASLLYFGGNSFRGSQFNDLGIEPTLSPLSIQDTLAAGALPVVVTLALAAFLYLAFTRLHFLHTMLQSPRIKENMSDPVDRTIVIGLLLIGGVLVSSLAGGFLGREVNRILREKIKYECHQKCFIYDDGKVGIMGISIAQDSQRTIIMTSKGVRIMETAKIWKVRPATPIR